MVVFILVLLLPPPVALGFGTWEQIKDKFILSAGSTYAAGSTGGSVSHNHSLYGYGSAMITTNGNKVRYHYGGRTQSWTPNYYVAGSSSGEDSGSTNDLTDLTGNTSTTNHMPPYLAAYVWKRVS